MKHEHDMAANKSSEASLHHPHPQNKMDSFLCTQHKIAMYVYLLLLDRIFKMHPRVALHKLT